LVSSLNSSINSLEICWSSFPTSSKVLLHSIHCQLTQVEKSQNTQISTQHKINARLMIHYFLCIVFYWMMLHIYFNRVLKHSK
jgi:hypothetical protein